MKYKIFGLSIGFLLLGIVLVFVHNNINLNRTNPIQERAFVSGISYSFNSSKEDTGKDSLDDIQTEIKNEEELEAYMNSFKEQLLQEIQASKELENPIQTYSYITEKHKELINHFTDYIGVPYVWGGTSFSGFDCSGFVQSIYSRIGIRLPRVSSEQALKGESVSRDSLHIGDLLFFDTRNYRDLNDITTPTREQELAELVENDFVPNTVSHVGIYIGNGIMLHASSGDGYVTYSSLETPYYKSRFLFAKRLI